MKEQRTESLKSNQGIESMRGMRVSSFLRVGSRTLDLMEQLFGPPSLKSYMIEFMSSFILVFATVGSAVSVGLLMASNESQSPETDLLVLSMAHAFAFTVAVYVAPSGHVNPAVTFAYVIGGHISILKAICYLVAQLLGSTLACLFLMLVTSGLAIPTHGLGGRMSGFGGALMEGIVTFILVYTVYAARDPKRGSSDGDIGAIAIGFVAGANNLAVGPFTGGSMNPARSFGPAIITNDFKNQWVYWIGPMVGGGLAGLVYDHLICSNADQQPSLGGETVNL